MWIQDQKLKWHRYRLRNGKDYQQLPGERHGIGSVQSLGSKCSPADTRISDFWPLELWENTFMMIYASPFMVIFYGSPRKLTHYYHPPNEMVNKNMQRAKGKRNTPISLTIQNCLRRIRCKICWHLRSLAKREEWEACLVLARWGKSSRWEWPMVRWSLLCSY